MVMCDTIMLLKLPPCGVYLEMDCRRGEEVHRTRHHQVSSVGKHPGIKVDLITHIDVGYIINAQANKFFLKMVIKYYRNIMVSLKFFF